jgi:hypothetical protein
MFAELRSMASASDSYYDMPSGSQGNNKVKRISCLSYACIDEHSPNHGIE